MKSPCKPLTIVVLLIACFMPFASGTARAASFSGGAHPPHGTGISRASCSRSGCNGQDPVAAGCWSTNPNDPLHAYVTNTTYWSVNGAKKAEIDNWYSPACITNWNETSLYGGVVIEGITIQNLNNAVACYPVVSMCNYHLYYSRLSTTPDWTDMVDGTVQAMACLAPGDPQNYICGPWE